MDEPGDLDEPVGVNEPGDPDERASTAVAPFGVCSPGREGPRAAASPDRRRRALLGRGARAGGAALLGPALCAPAVLAHAAAESRRLVVVMLRGAVDGLSVVVPHGDPDYRRERAEIAIAPPGATDGALPLDATFGLHPALAALLPWWQSGRLGFVHASGSPDPTRSHFDAQDYMETAMPGRRAAADGWMNRLLEVLGEPSGGEQAVRGLSVGPSQPRILVGRAPVAALPTGGAAARELPVGFGSALDALHATDPATAPAWRAMRETRRTMVEAVGEGMDAGVAPGAVPLATLDRDAARLGRLMRREPGLRAAFLSVGGWDTHANQGGARGPLAQRLQALAGGLDALARGLDDALDGTVVLVLSEFGRTVRQNGTQGTDHGHGNVAWLLGGAVAGGRVHGRWPGLDAAARHEGRDLAITTDFRQVIAQVLERHLRVSDAGLARVLPDGPGAASPIEVVRG